jgi:hypothetical protein
LSKAEFDKNKVEFLEIELNHGGIIHLQNNVFRIEMLQEEFIHFASCVINSANQMIEYKGL